MSSGKFRKQSEFLSDIPPCGEKFGRVRNLISLDILEKFCRGGVSPEKFAKESRNRALLQIPIKPVKGKKYVDDGEK